jgi:prepilin-type processing-associated H-X9-DG protein
LTFEFLEENERDERFARPFRFLRSSMSFRKCVPGILFLLAVGGVVAVIAPVFSRVPRGDHRRSCASNLRTIRLAVKQYIQDYNESYPLTSTPNGGWVDGIYPYLKSTSMFQCPVEATRDVSPETTGGIPGEIHFDPKLSGLTDYYYNARLQGRPEASLKDISRYILLGDGNDGHEKTDASYAKYGIPGNWRTDKSSPAYRHLEGTYYAFADGHVKWLRVSQIKDEGNAGDNYYFWPKEL